MRVLETDIHISANPEKVWEVLTDLEKYSKWNPFIKNAQGKTTVGEKLKITILPPNGKEMVFKPIVKSIVTNKEFSWLGHFLFSGIFDAEHIFIIKPTNIGCTLIQKENFSDLLVPLLWSSLKRDTRAGFQLMNKALKERAEEMSI